MSTRELRELAEKATPGPWQWLPSSDKEGAHICRAFGGDCVVNDLESDSFAETDANAAFIAAANPETVLALLAVAEAAQTYRDAVEGGREDAGIALQVTYRSLLDALARLEAVGVVSAEGRRGR